MVMSFATMNFTSKLGQLTKLYTWTGQLNSPLNGVWGMEAKSKTFGTGMLEVGMGYFRLENGIKAVVFRHRDSEELLVINSSGGYYVIIHPGVEKVCEIVKCLVD